MNAPEAQFAPPADDPLRSASPATDDVEARRARAAVEGRLFSGPKARVEVGRYQVRRRIGSGGMGVVYRAHDPELARDVAVKLMNPESIGERDSRMARGRLVREARAMARLAHPNVIHVYDVGTVEDGVFIAMELVEGESLARWVATPDRTWQAILRKYIDAGRGLAAAHDAGVVHRDFKPENVLVGVDGRVRVGDFGLAGGSLSETGRHNPVEDRDTDGGSHPIGEALTRTGALLGTPKYMAPEQEDGAAASVRSDQFSFCVALFEALYGYPPYEGDTVAVYRMHVREGNLRAPPPDTLVPAWVSSEIVRGLAVDPQDRHPSMHVLLDHLETAIESPHLRFRIRRRIVVLGTAIFGIAGATALGWALGRQPAARALGSAAQRVESGMRAAARSAADAAHSLMPPAPAGIGTSTGGELSARASVESPDEVEKTKPESVAKPPAPAARRKPGVACYFSTDQRELLAHRRQHRAQLRVGEDCYVCSAAEPAIRESYTWPEDIACSRSRLYTCNSAPENCSASSPG